MNRVCPSCGATRKQGSTRCWSCDDRAPFDACPSQLSELAPVEGISLEQWAYYAARIAMGESVDSACRDIGCSEETWRRADARWNERMARDETTKIAAAYGGAFTDARSRAARPTAAQAGDEWTDTILDRLRAANETELRGIAEALHVPLSSRRDVDIVTLSKEYRSAAGNSFANVFRGDHDLTYRAILEDVVIAAGELAGFRKLAPSLSAPDKWLEQYVVHAMSFVERTRLGTISDEERSRAQRAADDTLHGRVRDAGVDVGEVASLSALAAGFIAVAFGVAALPFGIAHVALKWSRPALKKTLPATMWIIAIRERLERESDAEAEELVRLMNDAERIDFAHMFIEKYAQAFGAFRESRLDDALRLAGEARLLLLEAVRVSERGMHRFPAEERFRLLHGAATGSLPTIEQFLKDVQAFKALEE